MAYISLWKEDYKSDFEKLNREWIEGFFSKDSIEQLDLDMFSDPQGFIVDKGGQLFFVIDQGEVLGCCALLKHSSDEFELAKLAVSPKAQGRGLASKLMEQSLAYAKHEKAKKLVIESNTRLTSAMKLYSKFGFQEVKDYVSHYKRVNIKFEKTIN
ncbi:MAG: GNAT family N-acetyltransferase [Bacteroidales bacterium]|nr:GNAT family N-acetyltransferase [Candidatus Physcocola equi]